MIEFILGYLYEIIFGGVMSLIGVWFLVLFGRLFVVAFDGNWGDQLPPRG
ncbi:MAG: hypothetical protein GDA52_04795 [Rhodobacteraceae bacterium]|nr:hypothetical protein [Paracoccaceae bacterium]